MLINKNIAIVLVDIRSAHNVGSILRTADGLGANKTYLTGITPYPETPNDKRLPHLRQKITKQILKTSLGAEKTQNWEYWQDPIALLEDLKQNGNAIVAVEQSPKSLPLQNFVAPNKTVLVLGNEVHGLSADVLQICQKCVEIPMVGKKESFNVAVAAALALYQANLAYNGLGNH